MNKIFQILFLFFLISFLTGPPLSAQVSLRQTTKQDQRFIDEKLANEFYRNQDWESAKAMYLKLYETYNAQHYYNYYFNCLIQLNQLDEAEKSARKRQRSTKEVQNEIDLGYILMLKGDQKKANNMFEKVISDMPADRNQINQISNTFRTRNLDEYALQTYEKGSMLPGVNYAFNLEKAGLYQMTGNYSATIDAYLAHLTTQPDHLDVVKNRLLSLMSMDIDNSMAELIRQKLLIKAQSDPNVLLYGELLIWYALQQKEYDIAMIQAQALDKRLGDRDFSVLELAEISLTNSQYEVALNGFNYIAAKGQNSIYYFQGSKGALKARYYLAIENQIADKEVYKKISDDIDVSFQKMGFNKETYDLAIIQANIFTYQLNKPTEANSILNQALSLPLQPNELAHLKMYQADILLYQNDVWEATLLYSQIDKSMKNEPIAHEARFRNARLRYFIGEFSWSQLQLDVLKAATSKLIANDALNLSLLIRDNLMDDTTGNSLRAFARADLLTFQKKDKEALLLLDSLADHDRTLSLKPHVLMKKAEILIRENRQAEADSIYALVFRGFADGYLADDALFRSAVLNEYQLNNIQKAGSLYEIIFDKYPASIYAAQARQKYRLLRGDSI